MDEPGRSQQWYEQELEKIRTDGDIALVRAQAERQHIAEANARLRTLQRQLKDKKRQFARLAGATAGVSIMSDSAALEQINRRQEHARVQLEERLKVTNSTRTAELHRLRGEIDEQRRRRLDALASEKSVIDETRRTEESIKQSQLEMETLKERAGLLRSEIAQLQSELDHEQNTFRLERQQLQLDLDRIARPEKVAVKVKVLGRKFTVFRSAALTRKKREALLRAKKLSLQQKVVSFEQKKVLMDRLVNESGTRTLDEFIRVYNHQEAEKAQIMARVEAKSLANSSVKEIIRQLEEDITRLSGAGDIQSIVDMEQPTDLKRKINADEALIHQWTTEANGFQDALKKFRDPIHELHAELFPHERDDEFVDAIPHEVAMLRRIGTIEERVMQRVLMKILKETDASTNSTSDTLKRLQRYRGSIKRKEAMGTTSTPTDTAGEVKTSRAPPLVVEVPSLRDASFGDFADDDDDDIFMNNGELKVVRSEDYRPKKPMSPVQTIAKC